MLETIVQKNKCAVFSVIVTCSPQMVSGFMEVIPNVSFFAKQYLLVQAKTSPAGRMISVASGPDLGNDVELMIQVMFDTTGRLNMNAAKPKIMNEHFPFQLARHMENHPTSSPAATRMCVVKAAMCVQKYQNKHGQPANLSEKSQDLCQKLVS